MSTDAGHRYGTLRLGTVVIAASLAVLVLLGASGRAVASSSASGPRSASGATPAGTIVAEARVAMARAGSVTARGVGTTMLPGVGRATLTESDYVGPASGSQELSTASPGASPAGLDSADTVDVSGAVYVNADPSFWTATVGMAPASATAIAGRWVRIPEDSPVYAAAADDLTMPSLVRDLFHAGHYHESGLSTVDGERVITLTYRNTGSDAGPVTCDVSLGGSHLPVLVTIGGLSLRLGSWGTTRPLAVPSGSVPLPGLAGSTPSGLPAVA
jgi:hypothetical protein